MTNENQFYHSVSIGSLKLDGNLFLAPVAGYSDCAFRHLCRKGGANFSYTEMVSAEALVRGSGKTQELMVRAPDEDKYAVQIFGGEPETVAKAALIVAERVNPEVIDINAGCPVPKIIKSGAGSALTRDPERLFAVLNQTKKALTEAGKNIPVTVKIRSGWDSSSLTWKEAAEASLKAGADAITLHPRTRAQGYEGKADWALLAELVKLVGGKIPVFASGDIFSPESVRACFEQTGVDGVMFARGAMGNPFIFDETRRFLLTGEHYSTPPEVRISAGMEELGILIKVKGEVTACREMRKRFCAYSKGLDKASQMRASIVSANTRADFAAIFSDYFTL
ncbi:MAG: tRNA dihydrouridine synthase DusB [Spirochaetaceae bacterium]|nr:tRNA dihydrouridine synthase DusB [Spirochaetaceae bacterium]